MPPSTMTISSRPQTDFAERAQRAPPSSPLACADSCSSTRGTRSSGRAWWPASMPGTTPAMNSCPTEAERRACLPDRARCCRRSPRDSTMTIDGGIRMPSAPEVAITPAPKRFGITLRDHRRQHDRADRDHRRGRRAGHRGEQRAGDHAGQAKSAIPVADHRGGEAIMRRATPPWVRKLPARMKNGIAMISKLLDPGEQLERHRLDRHRASSMNRKVSTVRPSAIEIGMPVSISAISRPKMMADVHRATSLRRCCRASRRRCPRPGRDHGAATRRCARNDQATCRKRKHIR